VAASIDEEGSKSMNVSIVICGSRRPRTRAASDGDAAMLHANHTGPVVRPVVLEEPASRREGARSRRSPGPELAQRRPFSTACLIARSVSLDSLPIFHLMIGFNSFASSELVE
jgi:hypothetical protein